MKLHRIFTLLLVTVLLCSMCACGNAQNVGKKEMAANAAGSVGSGTADAAPGVAQPNESGQALVPADQKLIRTVNLNTQTQDMDKLLTQVEQDMAELGGYVESRNVYNGTSASGTQRTASMSIRIPAAQLDQFVARVVDNSNVITHTENTQDVTLSYVDTESRIKALETEEARVMELMAMAEDLDDVLTLERKLTDLRTELETEKSRIRLYDSLVSYSTVYLSVTEVKEYTVVEEEKEPEPEPGFWKRLGDGFVTGVKNVWMILKGLVILVVSAFPYLVLPAVVLGIIFVPRWVRERKFKKLVKDFKSGKDTEKKESEKEETEKKDTEA